MTIDDITFLNMQKDYFEKASQKEQIQIIKTFKVAVREEVDRLLGEEAESTRLLLGLEPPIIEEDASLGIPGGVLFEIGDDFSYCYNQELDTVVLIGATRSEKTKKDRYYCI